MKIRIVLALFAAAALLGGCDKKEEGGDKGGAASASAEKKDGGSASGGTGAKECDDYIAAMEKCPAMKGTIDQAKKGFEEMLKNDATKAAGIDACKKGIEAVKAACP